VPVLPARFVGRAAQLHVAGRLGFLSKSLVLLVNCRWSVGQLVCSRRVDSGCVRDGCCFGCLLSVTGLLLRRFRRFAPAN